MLASTCKQIYFRRSYTYNMVNYPMSFVCEALRKCWIRLSFIYMATIATLALRVISPNCIFIVPSIRSPLYYLKKTGYPIIYGLPASILEQATNEQECHEILKKFPTSTIFTCECVLPLAFPDEQIQLWNKVIHSL